MSTATGPLRAGLRLAVTTLTIVPMRPARVDRASAAVAMSMAPALGLALGLVCGGIGVAAETLGAAPLVAAVLAIGSLVLATRGLHLDGLADTADGLGSYSDAQTALAIMRKPDIGPFGVISVVLVLLAQAAAGAEILLRAWPVALAGFVTAIAAGRLAIALACRKGVPPARPDGLGAIVAGTVGAPALLVGAVAIACVSLAAVPGRPWQGPAALALALLASAGVLRHAVRRLGGITGDVLGAVCEVSATVTYVVLSM